MGEENSHEKISQDASRVSTDRGEKTHSQGWKIVIGVDTPDPHRPSTRQESFITDGPSVVSFTPNAARE